MKKKRLSGFDRRNTINFYAFIAPWLLGFLVLTVYPMIESLRLAMTDTGYSGDGVFIGLGNKRIAIYYIFSHFPLSLLPYSVLPGIIHPNSPFNIASKNTPYDLAISALTVFTDLAGVK